MSDRGSQNQTYAGSAYDSSLESDGSSTAMGAMNGAPSPGAPKSSGPRGFRTSLSRKRLVQLNAGVFAVIVLAAVGFMLIGGQGKKQDNQAAGKSTYKVSTLETNGLKTSSQLGLDKVEKLTINGQLSVTNSIALSPGERPSAPSTGQIYYDKASNAPYYYNGASFVSMAPTALPQRVTSIGGAAGVLGLGNGLQIVNNQLAVSSSLLQSVANSAVNTPRVTSLQGLTGDITFSAGEGIGISGTTITNNGVVGLTSGSANLVITNDGAGHYSITDTSSGGVGAGGGAGNVILGPSVAQIDNTNSSSLYVNKTGVGNLLQLESNGTGAFVVDQTGKITTGTINYSQVQGAPSVVNSVGGATGAISVGAGLSLTGNALANSGVVSLAGTSNQVIVSGSTGTITLSLPQSIATTSSPAFAGATLNGATSVTGANTFTVGTGATVLGGGLSVTGASSFAGALTVTSSGLSSFTGRVAGADAQNGDEFATLQQVNNAVAGGVSGGSGNANYIQNGTSTQTANFNVRSGSANQVTATLQGATGQTANILDILDSSGASVLSVAANGNTTLSGALAVVGDSNVGGTLSVTGVSTFSDAVTVNAGSGIVATFSGRVKGADAVGGDEFATLSQVSGAISGSAGNNNYIFNGTTSQFGNFNIQSASAASVAAVIQGAVGQTANLFSILDGTGSNLLTVGPDGQLALTADAALTGNVTVGQNLDVAGSTTLTGTLAVTGAAALGDTTISGLLGAGATTVDSLSVTGSTTLNGSTEVAGTNNFTVGTGATSLGGALSVVGATTLSSTLTVGSGSGVVATFSGRVQGADAQSADEFATLQQVQSLANGAASGGSGNSNYIQNGTATQSANFNIRSTAVGNVAAVIQGAAGQTADILSILDGSGVSALTVGADGLVAIAGNTTIAGTLGVTGATSLDVLTAGPSSLSNLMVTTNTAIGGTLAVTGVSTLAGAVGVGGALTVTGLTTLNSTLTVNAGSGIVATFSGRVVGANAVNTDEFVTLGQLNASALSNSGNGNYVQNGTTVQSANFFIKSAAVASAATAVLQQASSQTGNLLELRDSNGASIGGFSANGSLQVGAVGGSSTLTVNGTLGAISTTATGNNLNFSRASTNYIGATNASGTLYLGAGGNISNLRINANGSIGLQNATDSTTAFQVQNAAGINLLVADTLNGSLAVNAATTISNSLTVTGQIAASNGGSLTPIKVYGSANTSSTQYGVYAATSNLGTGNIIAVQGIAWTGAGSAVSSLYGSAGSVRVDNATTVTNAVSLYGQSPNITGSGAITNAYGLYLQAQAAAGVTNAYGVYQAGANDLNVFNGTSTFANNNAANTLTVSHSNAGGVALSVGSYSDATSNGTGSVISMTLNPATNHSGTASNLYVQTQANGGANNITGIRGIYSPLNYTGTGTLGNGASVFGSVTNSSTGTITQATGLIANVNNNSTGIIGNATALNAASPYNAAGGTIQTTYGLAIQSQSGTGIGTSYGIGQVGTADLNYFNGVTSFNNKLNSTISSTALTGSDNGNSFAYTFNPTANSSASTIGTNVTTNIQGGAFALSGTNYAASVNASYSGTGSLANGKGTFSMFTNASSGTVNTANGVGGYLLNQGAGTITSGIALYGLVQNTGTGVISNAAALSAGTLINSGGGTIQNAYGLLVQAQAGVGITNAYGLYQAGVSDTNVLNGATKIKAAAGSTSNYALMVGNAAGAVTNGFNINVDAGYNATVGLAAIPSSNVLLGIGAAGLTNSITSQTTGIVRGIGVSAVNSGGANIQGIYSLAYADGTALHASNIAVVAALQSAPNSSTTTGIALQAVTPSVGTGGTITNAYGLRIEAQAQTGITNAYGIYQAGASDTNVLNGATTISNSLSVNTTTAALNPVGLAVSTQSTSPNANGANPNSINTTYTVSTTPTSGGLNGLSVSTNFNGTQTIGNGSGINSTLRFNGTLGNEFTAINGEAINNATGTVGNLEGLAGRVWNLSTGVVQNGYSLLARSPQNTGGGTIGVQYGLQIQPQSGTGITTAYGIFQGGASDLNVFTGATTFTNSVKIQAGATTNTYALSVGNGGGGNYSGFNVAVNSNNATVGLATVPNPNGLLSIGATGLGSAITGLTGSVYGISVVAVNGANADVQGIASQAVTSTGAGVLRGISGGVRAATTGTVTNAIGVQATTPLISAGGSITNNYGVFIENQSVIGVGVAYGIYQAGTNDSNLLNGKVRIGTAATADSLAQTLISTNGAANKGLVIQAAASQAADLLQAQDSTGAVLAKLDKSGNLTVQSLIVNVDLTLNGHFITGGTTPTALTGAASGGGTVAVNGNDTFGTITITTGASPSVSGVLATLNFNKVFAASPRVIISPSNAAASNSLFFKGGSSTSNFTVNVNAIPYGATTYTFDYFVGQ